MKAKKIITIIMALTLALGIVGCGNDEGSKSTLTTTTDGTTSKKDDTVIIERTKESLLALGAKQTKDIIEVLKNHNLQTQETGNSITEEFGLTTPDAMAKSKSEWTGYEMGSYDRLLLDENGMKNNYYISYTSQFRDKDSYDLYSYDIELIFPSERVFKVDEYPLLKDLVKTQFGEDYDFALFESWVQQHIVDIDKDKNNLTSGKKTGSYDEGLMGGDSDKGERSLTYTIAPTVGKVKPTK